MSSTASRPWARRGRFAVARMLASLNALAYLAYSVNRWQAAVIPDPPPMDPYRFDVTYACAVTAATLVALTPAITLLWRRERCRRVAIGGSGLMGLFWTVFILSTAPGMQFTKAADATTMALLLTLWALPSAIIVLLVGQGNPRTQSASTDAHTT